MLTVKPIVDGFMWNTNLLILPNRFGPDALMELEILRRAHNYRARWWCIPDDEGQPIAAYDTFQFQVEVSPGSYLWGMMFAMTPGEDVAPPAPPVTNMLASVVDSCTGIPLFNDFLNCGNLAPTFNSKLLPVIMTKPRLILAPGLVNVEIANRTNAAMTCQLLLMFAEPCRVFEEEVD